MYVLKYIYCWKIAVNWHTPTVGIEPTAPPPSRSTVRRTNHCATAPFPKKNGYIMQLILCAVYRDTVLSPDVTTVTAQHCSPLRRRCSCSRTACICNRLENPNMIPRVVPLKKILCISPLPPMLENSSQLAHADGGDRTYGTSA